MCFNAYLAKLSGQEASLGQGSQSWHGAMSGLDGAMSLMVNSMWVDWGCIQNACELFGSGMALLLLLHLVVNSESS